MPIRICSLQQPLNLAVLHRKLQSSSMPEGFDLSSYDSEGADLLLQMPESLVDTSVLSSDAEGGPVLPPGF